MQSSAVEEPAVIAYEPAPCHCAPCNHGRLSSSPTTLIVMALIAVNYIPIVLFALTQSADAGRVAAVVFFHIGLVLMLLAYFMAMFTDPGTPPEEWQRQMQTAVAQGQTIAVCRRSGLYKPPRSHFDSVTQRLTLNMDHFCPWIVNTVGFYNRKFFMLFLVYTNLTLAIALITLASLLAQSWDWLQAANGAEKHWFPGTVNVSIWIAAMAIDAFLLLALLPFAHFHLRMASRNETTIEGYSNPKYDVGQVPNLRSVFGRSIWTWAVPLYCKGPDGDGIHWPVTTGQRTQNTTVLSHRPESSCSMRGGPSTFSTARSSPSDTYVPKSNADTMPAP